MRTDLALVSLSLLGACGLDFGDEPKPPRTNQTTQKGTVYNGPSINGPYVNGPYVNGPYVNGPYVNGPYVNGPYVNGPYVNGPYVNGPYVNGPYVNGPLLEGNEVVGLHVADGYLEDEGGERNLVGLELQSQVLLFSGNITIDPGAQLDWLMTMIETGELEAEITFVTSRMRIDAIEETDKYGLYSVSTFVGTDESQLEDEELWQPLCGYHDDGTPALAIPFQGLWNYNRGVNGGGGRMPGTDNAVTFACPGGALYKCIDMGYQPWNTSLSESYPEDPRDAHEACVRMVRLDVCGDGTSWTVANTLMHVHDAWGVQVDTTNTGAAEQKGLEPLEGDWAPEAGWSSAGAEWITGLRISQYSNYEETLQNYLSTYTSNPVQAACRERLQSQTTTGSGGWANNETEPAFEDCRSDPCLVTKYPTTPAEGEYTAPGDDDCDPEREQCPEKCDPELGDTCETICTNGVCTTIKVDGK